MVGRWGSAIDKGSDSPGAPPPEKAKPNFETSGKLAEDTNMVCLFFKKERGKKQKREKKRKEKKKGSKFPLSSLPGEWGAGGVQRAPGGAQTKAALEALPVQGGKGEQRSA